MSRTAFVGVLLTVLATAGCVTLPDNGGLEAERRDVLPSATGIRYAPPGPSRGESAEEIVRGFLEAMLASPVQTSTARAFLTERAANGWRPQQRVVVYGSLSETDDAVPGDLTLADAAWVDAAGRWRGALPEDQRRVRLGLVRDDGEWRIDSLPDALLARRSWFTREYVQRDVHFLDPALSVLVPEPVFVPRGGQLATSLVRCLLAGPTDPAAPWLVNRLGGLRLAEGAVTVTRGTARVDLTGEAALAGPEARTQLAAQLAWALRQVVGVRTFEVRIDDTPLTLAGGLTEIPVGHGALLDPAVASASDGLFGLVHGTPVRVEGDVAEPFGGPAWPEHPLRDLSVDLDARRAAGVGKDGHEVRVAPLDAAGPATTVEGQDFAHPGWDGAGRAWLLDRRTSGATVSVVVGRKQTTVSVPGVSGRRVTDLLVSRDGTRLLAAVRAGSRRSTVVESRLHWSGATVAASPATAVASTPGLRDLAWDGPTRVIALTARGRVAQVRWLSLDGTPEDVREALPVDTIFDDVRRVVSSGADREPAWAETTEGALISTGPVREAAPAVAVDALTWVG